MGRNRLPRLWLLAGLAACSINPATGKRELSFFSERDEIAMGDQVREEIRRTIGVYPDSGLQRYLSGLGLTLAATSERPRLPWSFEVIDDPEPNAFAAPGGKIFITRGLLAYLASEAELAGVVGHEIGHVTARHTARDMTRQTLFAIGLVAGSLLSHKIADLAGGIEAGLTLLFLKFSRDDEAQADALGFRYLLRGSYDVREFPKVFAALGRLGAASGGGRIPTWAATHPAPANREAKAKQRVDSVPPDSLRGTRVNQAGYLREIDGVVFGADPRQGYFEGTRFLHPELRFRVDFPPGWQSENRLDAVLAVSPRQDALMQLSLGGAETPQALLGKFTAKPGVQVGSTQRISLSGTSAVSVEFRSVAEDGDSLAGRVMYVSQSGKTYELLGTTVAQSYQRYAEVLLGAFRSFARLTDPAALAQQPMHLTLVRLPRAMTIEQFYRGYPSTVELKVVAALNGVEPGGTLPAGMLAKYVR